MPPPPPPPPRPRPQAEPTPPTTPMQESEAELDALRQQFAREGKLEASRMTDFIAMERREAGQQERRRWTRGLAWVSGLMVVNWITLLWVDVRFVSGLEAKRQEHVRILQELTYAAEKHRKNINTIARENEAALEQRNREYLAQRAQAIEQQRTLQAREDRYQRWLDQRDGQQIRELRIENRGRLLKRFLIRGEFYTVQNNWLRLRDPAGRMISITFHPEAGDRVYAFPLALTHPCLSKE